MIFPCDLGHVSEWLGLCFLHFIHYNCYVSQCSMLRGKGEKKDSKTGNDCSTSKLGKDLAESRCSYFFSLLTFSYSLCFTQSANDKNNNRKTILDLLIAFNIFSVPTGNINIFWLLTWE